MILFWALLLVLLKVLPARVFIALTVLGLAMFISIGVTTVVTFFFLKPPEGTEHFLWFYLYPPTYITFVLSTLFWLPGLSNQLRTPGDVIEVAAAATVTYAAMELLDKDKGK